MSRKTIEPNISYDDQRNSYYVCLNCGTDENGKRLKHYKCCPTLKSARQYLRQFQTQQLSLPVSRRFVTLDQWLRYWMDTVIRPNRACATIYGYQNIIDNHLSDALGDIPLHKLTAQHLQQYYLFLLQEKGLAPNTVRRHHDLLSCALHTAQRQEVILRCPTDLVDPPRIPPREASFYTPDDLKRLFRLVEGHWLEPVVKLAGILGLRREEICGLRWKNVDFDLRLIHICEARVAVGSQIVQKATKNRSSNRTLHMGDEIFRLLWRERKRQAMRRKIMQENWPDSGLVVVDHCGHPYAPNTISLAFTRFIRTNGLPYLTLHGLRHTFATVASAQGVPLFNIGKALGHSSPATTGRIYTHLLEQNHADTLWQVERALK